jgi:Leucine-rich repeat (LRR) protein
LGLKNLRYLHLFDCAYMSREEVNFLEPISSSLESLVFITQQPNLYQSDDVKEINERRMLKTNAKMSKLKRLVLRKITLKLSNLDILRLIPSQLLSLDLDVVLSSCSENQIKEFFSLREAPSLIELTFHCDLTEVKCEWFSVFMSTLRRLDISRNQIFEIDLDDFDLPNLEILDLSSNRLEKILKVTNSNGLKMLEKLNLANNFISKIESDAFRCLSNLKVLSLRGNRVAKGNGSNDSTRFGVFDKNIKIIL